MVNIVKHFFGYLLYNVAFWGLYYLEWANQELIMGMKKVRCKYFGYCNRNLSNLVTKQLKEVVFLTYFPEGYESKLREQQLFTRITRKLAHLHRYCFRFTSEEKQFPPDFSLADQSYHGAILIGFNTVPIYSRLLDIAKRLDRTEFGMVTKNKKDGITQLNKNYETNLPMKRNRFKFAGTTIEIFQLNNTVRDHAKLTRFLKDGGTLFFAFDLPTTQRKPEELFDKQGNPKEPSKFITYSYKGQKLFLASKYLLYLLHRTNSVGLPIYTKRLKDGRDRIDLGEPIYIEEKEEIENRAQDIYKDFFDFFSNKVLNSSRNWINSKNIAKIVQLLRKPGPNIKDRNWKKEYMEENFKLSSPVVIDRFDKETFILTSSNPVQTVKIGSITKKVISLLKDHGELTQEVKNQFSQEKLEPALANLWETGVIKKTENG